MKSINEILSKKLQVPKMKAPVTFRLCRSGVKDPNTRDQDGNVMMSCPAGHMLAGNATIYDPGSADGGVVLISNIVGQKPVTEAGKPTRFDPIIKSVEFNEKGSITCGLTEQGTYEYLMRHPKNRDNPYRDHRKPAVFYMEDVERDAKVELTKQEYMIDMLGYVRSLSAKDMIGLAYSLDQCDDPRLRINCNQKPEFIKKSLIDLVMKYPMEVIEIGDNERAKFKKMIQELQETGRVAFDSDPDKLEWKIKRVPGETGIKKLVNVEIGNAPVEALLDYLLSDKGEAARLAIREEHNKHYEVEV